MIEKRFFQGLGCRKPVAMTLSCENHQVAALLVAVACLLVCATLWAPSTARANTAQAVASGAAPAAQPEPQERMRVTVNRGESVMTLIRRTVPNSPYRDDFLRKAFHRMNPDAYVAGSPFRLKTGATVVVPSPVDLQRMAFGDSALPAAASPSATQARPELERKGWVRYP